MSKERRYKKSASRSVDDVVAERGCAYGLPEVNHARTANLWNAYLDNIRLTRPSDKALRATDVILLNVLQKVARLQHGVKHADSVVDIMGYCDNLLRVWEGTTKTIVEDAYPSVSKSDNEFYNATINMSGGNKDD